MVFCWQCETVVALHSSLHYSQVCFITLSAKTKPRTPATSCSRKITVRQTQNCGGWQEREGQSSGGMILFGFIIQRTDPMRSCCELLPLLLACRESTHLNTKRISIEKHCQTLLPKGCFQIDFKIKIILTVAMSHFLYKSANTVHARHTLLCARITYCWEELQLTGLSLNLHWFHLQRRLTVCRRQMFSRSEPTQPQKVRMNMRTPTTSSITAGSTDRHRRAASEEEEERGAQIDVRELLFLNDLYLIRTGNI